MPETLPSTKHVDQRGRSAHASRLLPHGKLVDRRIRPLDFIRSLRMIRYAAVCFPAIWYTTANTYGSLLFAVTGAHIGDSVYGFSTGQIGLFMGVPLTVGNILGEATAGWVSDVFVNAYARRRDGRRKAEVRLWLLPLTLLVPVGIATYGYCVENAKPWIDAAICMAIAGLGAQTGTTMVYTYATDSYKLQSGEIGTVINLFRSSMSSPHIPKLRGSSTLTKASWCSFRFCLGVLCLAFWRGRWFRRIVQHAVRCQCSAVAAAGASAVEGRANEGKSGIA